jgi:hypothetical protein
MSTRPLIETAFVREGMGGQPDYAFGRFGLPRSVTTVNCSDSLGQSRTSVIRHD